MALEVDCNKSQRYVGQSQKVLLKYLLLQEGRDYKHDSFDISFNNKQILNPKFM